MKGKFGIPEDTREETEVDEDGRFFDDDDDDLLRFFDDLLSLLLRPLLDRL